MVNKEFSVEPQFITVKNSQGMNSKKVTGTMMTIAGTTLQYQQDAGGANISVQSTVPVSVIKLRWGYQFNPRAQFLADEVERGYGNMGWQKLTPNRIMPWYFMVNLGQRTTGFGVMTQANAFCFWQADPAGITLIMDVRNGGNGVELGDRKLKLATIVSRSYEGESSFAATKEFCRVMSPHPVLPAEPVYGSNNWYYAYGKSSASEISSDTDYLVGLTTGIKNRPFMVIDDGWQVDHVIDGYNGGPWRAGNEAFPDMEALAKTITDKGAKPGIWFRPLLDHRELIPDEWRNPINGALDPTVPAVLDQVKGDVDQLCKWGYRLIKHDFTTFDLFGRWGFQMRPFVSRDGWNFADHSLTNAEVVKKLYRAIFEAAKPYHTLILGCNTVGHLGTSLMQLARVGDDTSGKEWERTRQMGINSLAFRLPQDGTFFSIDADCVGITDQIDWYYNRQWAQVVAESGTVLFISAIPGLMGEEQQKQLHKLMKVAAEQKEHFVPTDWQLIDYPANWSDGQVDRHYDWYEPAGLSFSNDTPRSIPFYSVAH